MELTLYLRHAKRLGNPDSARVAIVEGDVLDRATLRVAFAPAELAEFDAGLAGVVVQGKRRRDGLFELSGVDAPPKR